jgi:glycosyltransferase involved in cell wall biosynthesis
LKKNTNYVPKKSEFLWFFGSGVVHKGLDLLLEVFSKYGEFTLHVVGKVDREPDFMSIYRHELTALPNIRMHGPLRIDSERFREIIRDVFCFIAPSCSEGLSPAVVTCMQIGLYPVLSRDTGVTLPSGCGVYLENCSVEEIETAVIGVSQMETADLNAEITQCQSYALHELSRARFRERMELFLSNTLARH